MNHLLTTHPGLCHMGVARLPSALPASPITANRVDRAPSLQFGAEGNSCSHNPKTRWQLEL